METLRQPNGSTVLVRLQNINHLADLRTFDKNAKEAYVAEIYVSWGYGSFHAPYTITKTLYGDEKGLYTYKKQKEPIYYWKPRNTEQEYDNWSKKGGEYSVPLNEPRKIKKNYF